MTVPRFRQMHIQWFSVSFWAFLIQEELSIAGYRRHVESQNAAPPLTESEQEKIRLRENEVSKVY